jgi:hypothetical protein
MRLYTVHDLAYEDCAKQVVKRRFWVARSPKAKAQPEPPVADQVKPDGTEPEPSGKVQSKS